MCVYIYICVCVYVSVYEVILGIILRTPTIPSHRIGGWNQESLSSELGSINSKPWGILSKKKLGVLKVFEKNMIL